MLLRGAWEEDTHDTSFASINLSDFLNRMASKGFWNKCCEILVLLSYLES